MVRVKMVPILTNPTIEAGERLRAMREARGLTLVRLAGLSGLGVMTIWKSETSGRITRRSAERLAPVFGVKPESLIPSAEK